MEQLIKELTSSEVIYGELGLALLIEEDPVKSNQIKQQRVQLNERMDHLDCAVGYCKRPELFTEEARIELPDDLRRQVRHVFDCKLFLVVLLAEAKSQYFRTMFQNITYTLWQSWLESHYNPEDICWLNSDHAEIRDYKVFVLSDDTSAIIWFNSKSDAMMAKLSIG